MIRIEGITKSYESNNVLKGVDLSVATGSCTALVGRNGSDKSTLMDVICKAKKADKGRVQYQFEEKNIFENIGVQIQNA